METITLLEATKQGYTHFAMLVRPGDAEEFSVFPLNGNNLQDAIRRSTDRDYDMLKELEDMENFFGKKPYLCTKAATAKITVEQIVDKINDVIEGDDQLAPCVMEDMLEELPKDKDFIMAVNLLNQALAEYKSYGDTDIILTL